MKMKWEWYRDDVNRGIESRRRDAMKSLAKAIGRPMMRGLPSAVGGAGERYYYQTVADRDNDQTGAYAWCVRPVNWGA